MIDIVLKCSVSDVLETVSAVHDPVYFDCTQCSIVRATLRSVHALSGGVRIHVHHYSHVYCAMTAA